MSRKLREKQERDFRRRAAKLEKLLSSRGVVEGIQQDYASNGRLVWVLQFADGHIGRYSGALVDYVMPQIGYALHVRREKKSKQRRD